MKDAKQAEFKPGESQLAPRFGFKVTKLDEVPREFMKLDEDKVRIWLDAGGRAMPGLEVFED